MILLNLLIIFVLFLPIWAIGDLSVCPEIINRAIWGARPAVGITRVSQHPVPYVLIHHSNTPTCLNKYVCKVKIQSIQDFHMSYRNWDDIGYNFVIGGEGSIFEGRGWGSAGEHVKSVNGRSISICLMGILDEKHATAAQLMALESLIECGIQKEEIAPNYRLIGHRQVAKSTCPGDKMFKILKYMPNFIPPAA